MNTAKAAREVIARGSKSFALASRLFDARTRDRATMLYAWCRHADDVIDGQVEGHGQIERAGTMAQRLATLRAKTDAALAGVRTGELPYDALADVAAAVGLPPRYAHDLLDGFALDVQGFQPATTDDLLTYCYGVAGCVGVMMALVMGVSARDHATLARASDLGLAFQLNNIARDVAEDAANGRLYLPADALGRAGVAATPAGVASALADEAGRARVFAVVRALVGLAERYEASAGWGVPALPWRSAWAVLSAGRIYGDIGRTVRAAGPAGLSRRSVTSKAEKLKAVASALPAALDRKARWRGAPPSREGFWTPAFAD